MKYVWSYGVVLYMCIPNFAAMNIEDISLYPELCVS